MVAAGFRKAEAKNSIFYALVKELYLFKDLLTAYCRKFHPEIKEVTSTPIPLLKIIAAVTGKKELKNAVSLFAYFEKVKEPLIETTKTYKLLGEPQLNFQNWLEQNSKVD